MFRYCSRIFPLFSALFLLISANAMAAGSGAFRAELLDAGAQGKGSAFVGEANTPAAVYYNPAGLSQIKTTQISTGGAIIMPQVNYENAAGAEIQMRRNTFMIPHTYAAVPISENLTFGLGATSTFGLGTEWAQDSPLRYVATETVLEAKNYMITATYKISDQLSFAVGADNDDAKVSKKNKIFQSTGADDADFQLKAKDSAWGYRIATMYKINEQNQIGLMYRSRIKHEYKGKLYLDGLNTANTNFGPGVGYQGVFGGTSYETRGSEKYTLPQSLVLGYSFKPTDKWTFNADLEWMDWSSVKREALNIWDETDPTRLAVLNTGNPVNRDWKSVLSESLGFEYAATDRLRVRGGYYHHDTPIPEASWDPGIPDSDSHGFNAGFGYDLSKNVTLDMAYTLMIYEARKIDNTVGNSSGGVDGKYEQIANMLVSTITYKF